MRKRMLGILLTLCVMMCLVPTGAFAAERAVTGTAAISVNTRRILNPTKVTNGKNVHFVPNSYIYFGINGTAPHQMAGARCQRQRKLYVPFVGISAQ